MRRVTSGVGGEGGRCEVVAARFGGGVDDLSIVCRVDAVSSLKGLPGLVEGRESNYVVLSSM